MQEDNEALLAYFFLWRGEANPPALAKEELDKARLGLTTPLSRHMRRSCARMGPLLSTWGSTASRT
jgi:hypothetical protein